ncbi:thiopurine S-methyltransferase [Kordiimonas sp.]|uniref:thiopurine S-methyltransferase n=1 Tax=Kordiimonas sp. TaxID=1970157 RepID=UPI003A91B9FC
MEADFWVNKWQTGEIAFHEGNPNRFLAGYFDTLALPAPARVFVPLCGKTRDIAWLLARRYRVAGVELVGTAVDQLFAELGIQPTISNHGALTRYSAKDIDIYVGDIFNLNAELLGAVDAVYDRAALVALPKDTRTRYTGHLSMITNKAPQLLISYEYDQARMDGPPFSVSSTEIAQHYGGAYEIKLLTSADVPGGLKGRCPSTESVWLLRGR